MDSSIGIRVLRGIAVAIAVNPDGPTPSFAGRAQLLLSDPKIASTLRPFHAMARLPREKAQPMVERDEAIVRRAASTSMRSFVSQLTAAGMHPLCAAIVSDGDPEMRVSNAHLEAHALERRLFREATASAARECGIQAVFLEEAEVTRDAAKIVGVSTSALDTWLAQIGVAAGRPWRAEEKTAAAVSWITSMSSAKHRSTR